MPLDAETIGIPPNAPEAAAKNTRILSAARTSVHFSGKPFYVELPIRYTPNGGTIEGEGRGGVTCDNAACFNDDNHAFSVATRLIGVNPTDANGKPVDFLVLAGTGQRVRDLQLYGRNWEKFHEKPTGPKPRAAIAVEGYNGTPTGRGEITNVLVDGFDYAILSLNTPVEDCADSGYVRSVYAYNTRALYGSLSKQAVAWTLDHCSIEEGDAPIVGLDVPRGGKINFPSLHMNGVHVTVLKRGDLDDDNTNYFRGDVQIDSAVEGGYVRVVDSNLKSLSGYIGGHLNNKEFKRDLTKVGWNSGIVIEMTNLKRGPK